jgi:hypothetical protein
MLKPGYVPKGWTRGELLEIHKAGQYQHNRRGFVMQKPTLDINDIGPDRFMIEFDILDCIDVDAWIEWWQEGTKS